MDCFRAASPVYPSAKHFLSEEFSGNWFQCLQTAFREIYHIESVVHLMVEVMKTGLWQQSYGLLHQIKKYTVIG